MLPLVGAPAKHKALLLPDAAPGKVEARRPECAAEIQPFRVGMEYIDRGITLHVLLHIYERGKKELVKVLILHVVILYLPGAPFVIDIVRGIGDHEVCFRPCHQHIVCLRQSGIPDHQPVPPKRPNITHLCHGRLFQFRVNVKVILRHFLIVDGIE
ncbi:hypothetical protein IMSAGC019_00227 [Lachnospiraceae bacterium]|nr:hypothetical protein IMSAGC019_00227 [Lachnospiraceae bacterium]